MSHSVRKENGVLAEPGGVVVVTRFQCHKLRHLIAIWWLHQRIKPAVRRASAGFLGVRLYIDWRARQIRSVSLWSDGVSLFDMGEVGPHIRAAHAPARWGVETSGGVFGYLGDWRMVMFGGSYTTESPLNVTLLTEPVGSDLND